MLGSVTRQERKTPFCLIGNSCACRRRLPDGNVTQACGLLKGGLFTPIGVDRFAVKLAGSALHPQDTARKRQEGARRGRSRENRAHFCPEELRGKAAPPADTAGRKTPFCLGGVFGFDRFARRETPLPSPLLIDRYIILLVLVVGTVELWKTRFFEEKGEDGAF